jgi:hypothetical protein
MLDKNQIGAEALFRLLLRISNGGCVTVNISDGGGLPPFVHCGNDNSMFFRELREDGSFELREDSTNELKEN